MAEASGPAKQGLREEAWAALRAAGAARFPGTEGRIPNFVGAEAAARRLSERGVWSDVSAIKANPDSPQWPVRTWALQAGKVLYMAVPRLREEKPFWRLDLARLSVPPRRACSIRGAAEHGLPVGLGEMDRIDLLVCGSVAVDPSGARLGKGGGYSDLEFGLGVEAGLIGPWTTIATTVHPSQVIEDGKIPMTAHDFPVDLIVTPEEVIETSGARARPGGILWDHLSPDKLDTVQVLQERVRRS